MVLPDELPDDVEQLQELVRELFAQYQRTEEDRARLKLRLDELLRRTYGRKTEQVSLQQLQLFLDGLPSSTPADPADKGHDDAPASDDDEDGGGEGSGQRRRRNERGAGTGRRPLPENLRRIPVDVPPLQQGPGWKCIGYETSERLEWHPGEWVVLVVTRPKMVREGQPSEGVISPALVNHHPSRNPGHPALYGACEMSATSCVSST